MRPPSRPAVRFWAQWWFAPSTPAVSAGWPTTCGWHSVALCWAGRGSWSRLAVALLGAVGGSHRWPPPRVSDAVAATAVALVAAVVVLPSTPACVLGSTSLWSAAASCRCALLGAVACPLSTPSLLGVCAPWLRLCASCWAAGVGFALRFLPPSLRCALGLGAFATGRLCAFGVGAAGLLGMSAAGLRLWRFCSFGAVAVGLLGTVGASLRERLCSALRFWATALRFGPLVCALDRWAAPLGGWAAL